VAEPETEYTLQVTDEEVARYQMMAEMARAAEGERWVDAGVVAGAAVADVGCGPAAVLAELAQIVGDTGTAIGVEPDPSARAAARRLLDGRGLQHVEVREGRGDATGLEPASWDCVMMRHVLTHTGAAQPRIVEHLATLLRPGGHLYLVDVDLEGARQSPEDPTIAEQFERYAAFHRDRGNDVRTGPHLGELVRAAGLEVVHFGGMLNDVPGAAMASGGPVGASRDAMLESGHLQPSEVEAWEAARLAFAATPGSCFFLPVYVAIGRRSS
jgi:SAM-dependent methyltransferase